MLVRLLLLLPTLFLVSKEAVEGARILAVTPNFVKSHHSIIQPILRTLAQAGHELVVYSPYPLPNPPPTYTHMHLDNVRTKGEEIDNMFQKLTRTPHYHCAELMFPLHEQMIHALFQSRNIRHLLHSDEKFDLVITETFLAQEFTLIFGHIFKAPTIGIQTFATTNLPNNHLGNAFSIAFIPDLCFPFSNKMSFVQRFLNSFGILRGNLLYYYDFIPTLESKLRVYIPDAPPLLELTKNVSLMFINDHTTADYAQPRPPNMIPVAGIHIEPAKPLPKDIKKFMDEASHGVILFSMGSLVPDDAKPEGYFEMYANVFRQLRQRVLWKTRKDTIEGLSDNVMLVKWLPQRDVLAHPKCVLFITHGGLASQHETIYNGVPVVGVPHFADQHRNVKFYEAQEVGVGVRLSELTEDTMLTAILEVLGDPKYKKNMKELSRRFKDQPMSPAESVVFWTEYVLRHKGALHLKPASAHMKLYQLALLDVIAAALMIVLSLVAAVYYVYRRLVLPRLARTRYNLWAFKKLI